jgi:hypothetical protein
VAKPSIVIRIVIIDRAIQDFLSAARSLETK